MKTVWQISIFCLFPMASGLVFLNQKAETLCKIGTKNLSRKSFLAGVVGTAVIGTATASGAAVTINNQVNGKLYEPTGDSMNGKVVLITGGTSGLGLESAKRLAVAGATVVLTSRTASKGEMAVESVKQYVSMKGITGTPKVFSLLLDLDDLENVKKFPASLKNLNIGKIDVLMNNAGVMAIPKLELTKDGYERTFQSNHLGHFVLTAGIFPLLSREKTTVINVSSEAFNFASTEKGQGLDINNLNGERKYGPWSSYGLSKLANILFTQELQRRANEAGDTWLTAVTLHPGAVATDLGRYLIGEEKFNEMKKNGPSGLEFLALNAASLFTKTVQEGASTQIFLAAGADGRLKKGAFYEDLKLKKNLPNWATETSMAKMLWEKSEELGGVKFDIKSEPINSS